MPSKMIFSNVSVETSVSPMAASLASDAGLRQKRITTAKKTAKRQTSHRQIPNLSYHGMAHTISSIITKTTAMTSRIATIMYALVAQCFSLSNSAKPIGIDPSICGFSSIENS